MPNQVRVGFGITGASKAESDLDKLKNKITGIQKAGVGGVTKGVALGIGIGVVNAATTAVYGLGDALGDAAHSAIEDEESQQKLKTTIKASIPAWDGYTGAIENVISARMKLGFSDEDQRDSLGTLVTATHNVTKALDLERGAMDIARKANVPLAVAADAVAKAYGGQAKQLRSLIPGLKVGATAGETIANAFDAAAGQGEDFAKTMGGKMVAANVKMNESMEKLGYVIAPAAADGLSAVADGIEGVASGLQNIMKPIADFADAFDKEFLTPIEKGAEEVHKFLNSLGLHYAGEADNIKSTSYSMMTHLKDDFGAIGGSITDLADTTQTASGDITDYFDDMRDAAQEVAQSLVDDFFDPIDTRFEILGAHRKLEADKAALAAAETSTAIHDATHEITGDLEKQADGLTALGKQHKLTKGDVDKFKKDTIAAYKAMGRSVPPQLQVVLDKLYELAGFTGGSVDINVKVKTGVQGHSAGKKRAAGGPVNAGEAYTVGENGPETLVMGNQGGTVLPNGALSGGGHTINIYGANVSNPERIRDVLDRGVFMATGKPWDPGGPWASTR